MRTLKAVVKRIDGKSSVKAIIGGKLVTGNALKGIPRTKAQRLAEDEDDLDFFREASRAATLRVRTHYTMALGLA